MARLVVLLVLALILFGPQDLPRLTRTLGRAMGELRRTSEELTEALRAELEALEREEATRPPNA